MCAEFYRGDCTDDLRTGYAKCRCADPLLRWIALPTRKHMCVLIVDVPVGARLPVAIGPLSLHQGISVLRGVGIEARRVAIAFRAVIYQLYAQLRQTGRN